MGTSSSSGNWYSSPAVQANPDPSCGAPPQGHGLTVDCVTLRVIPLSSCCLMHSSVSLQFSGLRLGLFFPPRATTCTTMALFFFAIFSSSRLADILSSSSSLHSLSSVWTQPRLLWETHREGTKSGPGSSPQDSITGTSVPRARADTGAGRDLGEFEYQL